MLVVFNFSCYYFTEEFEGLSHYFMKTFKHLLGVALLSFVWYYIGNKTQSGFNFKKYLDVFLVFWLITIMVHIVITVILEIT